MPEAQTFRSHSETIAAGFLQTVVVVDDQASFDSPEEYMPTHLTTPGRRPLRRAAESITPDASGHDIAHSLNAKVLIDRFAEQGLVCAVLKPTEGENPLQKTINAARRADALVLDWELNRDDGDTAINIIKTIIRESEVGGKQLRLIVIYTGQGGIPAIIDKIADQIGRDSCLIQGDGQGLTQDTTRIVAFAKSMAIGALRKMKVTVDQLPERVIQEFSAMTAGLVSNVALASLAAIRSNTHLLLRKFSPSLDAPFLTHRALLNPPEEAEEHLIPLIAAELQTIMEDKETWSQATADKIDMWLDAQCAQGVNLRQRLKMKSKSNARQLMLSILKKGVAAGDLTQSSSSLKKIIEALKAETDKQALDKLTDLICIDGKSGAAYDSQLAMLMSLRSRYSSPIPRLTLGTIIAEDANDNENTQSKYWLCLQPRCDSVHFSGKRAFPFLKLIVKQSGESFDCVVTDENSLVRLKVSVRPYESALISFKPPAGKREIVVHDENNTWKFKSSDNKKYRWIADLKPEQAQRVANEFAAQAARVGLTESEWLRRWAKK